MRLLDLAKAKTEALAAPRPNEPLDLHPLFARSDIGVALASAVVDLL
jgi:hypothetical protein